MTTWHPTIVWPYMLEVSHYLFFTNAWELGLSWHVMIPPYDWTTIYLRARDALTPAMAFQIDPVSDPAAVPHMIAPPSGSCDDLPIDGGARRRGQGHRCSVAQVFVRS